MPDTTTNFITEVNALLDQGWRSQKIISHLKLDDQAWYRISNQIYRLHLKQAQKQRRLDEEEKRGGFTKNNEINDIIALNEFLADYALGLPDIATLGEFNRLKTLAAHMPQNEDKIIDIIESIIMDARIRALQQQGRFAIFPIFRHLSGYLEAATLAYYRGNYISAFFTLVPIVEGVMLRWSGYQTGKQKPAFATLNKFFTRGYLRHPRPGNPLFYDVFTRVCTQIIQNHLFVPTQAKTAHANFNRHLALHLLSDETFASRQNCIRLFLLIDMMAEIYFYETGGQDPRFLLSNEDITEKWQFYAEICTQQTISSPEKILLRH